MKNEKWTQVSTNKLVTGERVNSLKATKIVKSVKRKTYEELEKASKESFKIKQEREENLLQAFEDKKLKSKTLIKEAKALKKAKEKADKAAAKKEE
jgi:hypothetical protein